MPESLANKLIETSTTRVVGAAAGFAVGSRLGGLLSYYQRAA
jgi:hypothetical protein